MIDSKRYDKWRMLLRLMMAGDLQEIKSILSCRMKKEEVCYLLCRKTGQPPIKYVEYDNLNIKQLSGEKLVAALSDAEERTEGERLYFERRKRLVKYKIGRCYVSFDEAGIPCHFQWIFDHEDNGKLADHFHGEFPDIAPEEFMLEHALTLPSHRGKKIHDRAHSNIIAMEERNPNIRQCTTFINPQNAPTMSTARKLGFVPVMKRKERWFFFTHRFVFERYENGINESSNCAAKRDS